MSKEFVWELEIDDEYRIFRCVVEDTEVITYEGDVEKKHLKITNPVKKIGILQIDTTTRIYGDMIPFRMENDTPYLLVDGTWIMSDTTRDQRLEKAVETYRRNSTIEVVAGIVLLLASLGIYLVKGELGQLSMMAIIGVMILFAGFSTMVRLKQELAALVEAEKEKAAERAAKKAAREAQMISLEAPAEENEAGNEQPT